MKFRLPLATIVTTLALSLTIIGHTVAEDRSKEIDFVFSQLMGNMPVEGSLSALPFAKEIGHYGDLAKAKLNTNSQAFGGEAYEIAISRAGKNAYDAGAFLTIGGEMKKGDMVYILFFARLLSEEGGDLGQVGLQMGSEPYTASFQKPVTITKEWESYTLAGKAHKDFASYESQINFQLAAEKQHVALGPVFVVNLGSNVTREQLPFLDE